MSSQIKQLLKDHSLRLTEGRMDVLSIFMDKDFAISHGDIETEVNYKYDRVTIYRTLKSFLDKGLIHKVLDDNGSTRYALCDHACSIEAHQHDHIHFKCLKCGQTTCLDAVDIPSVKLPPGFQTVESNYLISGICNRCSG